MKTELYKKLKIFHFASILRTQIQKKNLFGVIFGNFGAQNMGDEAILSGELAELNRVYGVNVVVVSKNPPEIKRLHNTPSISLHNPILVLSKILRADFVLVGGGGIICKADRGILGIIYQTYTTLLYFVIPKMLRKKIYVLGLGIYENTNPLILKASLSLLKSVDLLTVRDFHSYNLLKKHNIKSRIYKDNSFLMSQFKKSEVLKIAFFKKNYDKNNRNVGIALLAPEEKSEEEYLISELIRMVRSGSKNTHYWFYSCDFQKGFNNDLLFSKKIIKRITKDLGHEISYSIVPTTLSPQTFFSSFVLMDFIISMRLHASIFAYRNNIEFLGLTYDRKCTSFLKSVGKMPENIKSLNFKKSLLLNTI